jgi:hypothetical protein
MTRLELYKKAASDEVLREWLRTMYKESVPDIQISYDSRKNVAKTPSSFNGSVGSLVDGRLIKIEYKGVKGRDEAAKIMVQERHVAKGSESIDIAVLSAERVIEGMLAQDFGKLGYVTTVTVAQVEAYEDHSGPRVHIALTEKQGEELDAGRKTSSTYSGSMSRTAFNAANIAIGEEILLIKHCDDSQSGTRVAGIAKSSPKLVELMNNNWEEVVEAEAA